MEPAFELNAPAIAPGCYGSPTAFSHDSDVCKVCPVFADCSSACIATLQALRSKINIEDILARHRAAKAAIPSSDDVEPLKPDFSKFLPSVKKPQGKVERKPVREPVQVAAVPESMKTTLESLTGKPHSLAASWVKRGLVEHIRTELQQGRNPFASVARHNFVSVTCDELCKGTVTAAGLKRVFMTRCGIHKPWEEASAASHVRIVIPALIAFGIIQETSEGYVVVPASS